MTLPRKKLPNIILIVLDTARAKSFSCYGYHRKTTPNIDRIAEESTLYKWCFSPANWTVPSHASLFTGLYPSEHGCDRRDPVLNRELRVLPEILRDAGYRTYGISCNGLVSGALGFTRGFSLFREMFGLLPFKGRATIPLPGMKWREKLQYLRRLGIYQAANVVVKKVVNRVSRILLGHVLKDATPFTKQAVREATILFKQEKGVGEPFFLFLNLMQCHCPYRPPKPFQGKFGSNCSYWQITKTIGTHMRGPAGWGAPASLYQPLVNLYDEEVHFVDSLIGVIWESLRTYRLLDNSVVAITSDHGELIGEHNGLYDHNYSLYNELLRVPLIIRFPRTYGVTPGVCKNIVQTHDLFTTIAEVIESPFPTPPSSINLLNDTRDLCSAECPDADALLAWETSSKPWLDTSGFPIKGPEIAFIDCRLTKWYYGAGKEEIYDLNNDPWEEKSLFKREGTLPIKEIQKRRQEFFLHYGEKGRFLADNIVGISY